VVRGWANNAVAEMNKHKQIVAAEFNHLDLEAENRMLDRDERLRMKKLAKELDQIWALKDFRARQRSRDRNVLEGDRILLIFRLLSIIGIEKRKLNVLEVLMVICMTLKGF
jgi:hypothetical protein